jgi:hypothetical protein
MELTNVVLGCRKAQPQFPNSLGQLRNRLMQVAPKPPLPAPVTTVSAPILDALVRLSMLVLFTIQLWQLDSL